MNDHSVQIERVTGGWIVTCFSYGGNTERFVFTDPVIAVQVAADHIAHNAVHVTTAPALGKPADEVKP